MFQRDGLSSQFDQVKNKDEDYRCMAAMMMLPNSPRQLIMETAHYNLHAAKRQEKEHVILTLSQTTG
ncbi:hypothetical protein V1264_005524 [Littorina saxatilis]|uniref:Uncharacterized protein n=1 Tax=Littorina saxatilis TaxID=31220 RepID=A0AAN9AZC2_9CAEN